mmetsp:Transcript_9491/g.24181  ORF Transcript_9491/g.24181 Transcript_9491/m.24181 type:complete len:228 (+) Transcript_9491:1065-1748(+)
MRCPSVCSATSSAISSSSSTASCSFSALPSSTTPARASASSFCFIAFPLALRAARTSSVSLFFSRYLSYNAATAATSALLLRISELRERRSTLSRMNLKSRCAVKAGARRATSAPLAALRLAADSASVTAAAATTAGRTASRLLRCKTSKAGACCRAPRAAARLASSARFATAAVRRLQRHAINPDIDTDNPHSAGKQRSRSCSAHFYASGECGKMLVGDAGESSIE